MNFYPRGMATLAAFEPYLTPVYLRRLPAKDGWNTIYYAYTDAAGDHYTIESYAKDKVRQACVDRD